MLVGMSLIWNGYKRATLAFFYNEFNFNGEIVNE